MSVTVTYESRTGGVMLIQSHHQITVMYKSGIGGRSEGQLHAFEPPPQPARPPQPNPIHTPPTTPPTIPRLSSSPVGISEASPPHNSIPLHLLPHDHHYQPYGFRSQLTFCRSHRPHTPTHDYHVLPAFPRHYHHHNHQPARSLSAAAISPRTSYGKLAAPVQMQWQQRSEQQSRCRCSDSEQQQHVIAVRRPAHSLHGFRVRQPVCRNDARCVHGNQMFVQGGGIYEEDDVQSQILVAQFRYRRCRRISHLMLTSSS